MPDGGHHLIFICGRFCPGRRTNYGKQSHRTHQREIQRELSALIPAVKDPRVSGMISLTAVETTPDLRYAKAYISVLDKENGERVLATEIRLWLAGRRRCCSAPCCAALVSW